MIAIRDLPTAICLGCAPPLVTVHVVADLVLLGCLTCIVGIRARPMWRARARYPLAGIGTTGSALAIAIAFALTLQDVVALRDPSFALSTIVTLFATAVALGTTIALAFTIPHLGPVVRSWLAMSSYNEGRFLAAANSSHDAFFILEAVRGPHDEIVDCRVAFANGNAAGLLSMTLEALRGTTLRSSRPIARRPSLTSSGTSSRPATS
jgi:hypothetical protein